MNHFHIKICDKTRVCPYLLDLEPTDITGPLTQFQAAKANKEDTKRLMQAINHTSGSQILSDERFNRLFEINWPRLEEILKKIPGKPSAAKQPARKEKDMIDETLRMVREHSRILSELSNDMQYFFDN